MTSEHPAIVSVCSKRDEKQKACRRRSRNPTFIRAIPLYVNIHVLAGSSLVRHGRPGSMMPSMIFSNDMQVELSPSDDHGDDHWICEAGGEGAGKLPPGPAPVRGYREKDRRIGDATSNGWQLASLAIFETSNLSTVRDLNGRRRSSLRKGHDDKYWESF